jgi:hypothetical protein
VFKPTKSLILIIVSSLIAWQSLAASYQEMKEDDLEDNLSSESWSSDNWAEKDVSPWKFSGFAAAGYGYFLQKNMVKSNASLSEITARFNLDYSHKTFDLVSKGELIYNDVQGNSLWEIREFNLSFSPTDSTDVKLGRQILTWGTGHYVFLNDLFAKNWQSFFSGRDDQYLKAPSNSVKGTWYMGGYSIDLTWTPEFTPDVYLTGERFSFYSPQAQDIIAPADNFQVEQTNDAQWATRIATNKNGVEYAFYGYNGFWPTPVGMSESTEQAQLLIPYFPKMNAWGASIRMAFAGGLLNAEYSNYNSIEDNKGTNPFIANGQQRFLIGYETEVFKNLTASMQFYLEQTKQYNEFIKHSPNPAIEVDENRQLITLRLRYSAMQQKLIYSFFSFYSPTDNDGYLKPSVSYRQNDLWSYTAGANIFWGKESFSFFGQHQDNTNVWLRARYQF